ncbi:hypothetical protein TTHERM_00326870 (macronuclear) [Tetrahymena thermophila SB210]|uniref:Uncharacterized protein n=1 Tax=Tetrahymena thermophila (strain SB210) TaxID=312017 RepID=I7MJE5_TETTS|nr:hypothetical protein TTHERM_00326870 [Tetrahymena thermophila SB210]EAS06205.1 hypothetical protein TTHERM_00326870 [Tetrahymena thermophila SB210]|eukprot:XP_001026450.1 hypothetical protein TTHERM_00326870 [Tetrahymena thermophila SB210]
MRSKYESHNLFDEGQEKTAPTSQLKSLDWKVSSEYYLNSIKQQQDHCQGNYQQFFQSQISQKKKFTFKSHQHELAFTCKLNQIFQCSVCQSPVLRYFWKCDQCKYYICLNCSADVDTFKEFYESLTKPQFCFIDYYREQESKLLFIKHLVKPNDVCYICRYPIKLYSWSDLKLGKHACLNCANSFNSVLPVDPLTYKQKFEKPKQNQIELNL